MYSQDNLPKIIAILGPTGSGKTALSLDLAKKFAGEIVSADSRQLYSGMDIGTDKVEGEMVLDNGKKFRLSNGVKHYMIDVLIPLDTFSVAEYKRLALLSISTILNDNKLPFLVGGTTLYTQSIIDNYNIPEVPPNDKIRSVLTKRIETEGLESLGRELLQRDPQSISFIDFKNPRRVIRALEVCLITGKLFSSMRVKGKPMFDVLQIGKKFDKELLKKKIWDRVDCHIANGLVAEVRGLVARYGTDAVGLDSIGYKQLLPYITGKIPLDVAILAIKRSTWRYAKRQITWYKKDTRIHWVDGSKEASLCIESFLLDK